MHTMLRNALRRSPAWIKFQELNREGWREAFRRARLQRRILATPPLRTEPRGSGPLEVHVLTWRRDCINALWTIKSFYYFTGGRYPLVIHDGGLEPAQTRLMQQHLPEAAFLSMTEGDQAMNRFFEQASLPHCARYRHTQPFARKLFDFFALSEAEHILSLDSDILFFEKPDELIQSPGKTNWFNRDPSYCYTLPLDKLESLTGIRPVPYINAGLSLVARVSLDYALIERCLQVPGLLEPAWLAEQTLHALSASAYGAVLLPDSYVVSTEPGLSESIVAKHYPGFFRRNLYVEGMAKLIEQGFLERLQDAVPRPDAVRTNQKQRH